MHSPVLLRYPRVMGAALATILDEPEPERDGPGAPLPAEYDAERPWTRQPCDTDAAWLAFLTYRDAPLPRVLNAVAAATGHDDSSVYAWARDNAWRERAMMYDRHMDRARTDELERVLGEDVRARAFRHLRLLRDLEAVAAHKVRGFLQRIKNRDPLDEINPRTLVRLIECTITMQRLIYGEATSRVQHEVDLSRLSLEELEQLRMLEAKVVGEDGETAVLIPVQSADED